MEIAKVVKTYLSGSLVKGNKRKAIGSSMYYYANFVYYQVFDYRLASVHRQPECKMQETL